NARTLDEAIAILEHASPLGAAAYVIVDGNARTWAVVERSPTAVFTWRKPPAPAIGDVLRGEPFVDDPVNDRALRTRPSVARVERAAELARAGIGEPAAAVALLRDRHAPGGGALPLGHRAAIDDLGVAHAAVFDASALVLWVSD